LKKIRAIRETLGSHFRCTGGEDRQSEKKYLLGSAIKVETYMNLTTRIHDKTDENKIQSSKSTRSKSRGSRKEILVHVISDEQLNLNRTNSTTEI
jgi:hypothetical protein